MNVDHTDHLGNEYDLHQLMFAPVVLTGLVSLLDASCTGLSFHLYLVGYAR